MALHAIIYHGRFQLNYERLKADPDNFQIIKEDGSLRPVSPPSAKVTGLVFGNMERKGAPRSQRFCIVKVQDIVLGTPVDLDLARHTGGKGLGPNGCQMEDEYARNLLEDLALANPVQKQGLLTLVERFLPKEESLSKV
jgi:hypothetical protein